MKKFFFPLLFVASLGLTGCNASMSSNDLKGNLEGKGYTVEVMSRVEAEARIQGINFVVEIKDAVYTLKGEHDVFLAFVCNSIDDASKFANENVAVMVSFAERSSENPKVGSHNNVAYTGSYDAVAAAGIPVSK